MNISTWFQANSLILNLNKTEFIQFSAKLNLGTSVCIDYKLNYIENSQSMRVNQKVKAIFKLHDNWDREEPAHCAVLTMPVEEFSHLQYSALPSVEWQQREQKHGRLFARLHHQRMRHSAVSLGRRSEACGNSLSYVGSEWTEHHESTKGL